MKTEEHRELEREHCSANVYLGKSWIFSYLFVMMLEMVISTEPLYSTWWSLAQLDDARDCSSRSALQGVSRCALAKSTTKRLRRNEELS